jgi:RNA polymerase sigma factor (sigma-70 family)
LENAQIIASFKNSDQRVIEEFYGALRPKFMNWLKGTYRIGRQEDAGEIYQRSFTVLYMNAKKGKLDAIEATVETYLFGIAKFVVLEWQREEASFSQKSADDSISEKEIADFQQIFEDAQVDDSMVRKMQHGLSQLGGACQKILKLFYWNSYSMEAIAREAGYKNESVAKKKKYNCLQKLKTLMRNE